ncbi:unnamed protein product [Cyclocybe aegerita]|uniref:Uncharacterized protein n=1 Tax=Cyclocybe aegerita TaxID=1973307 RepID=A0A8S0X9G7_CYCAE|nr:unnamed protein product [Cyclocybe aegerita]
MSAHNDSEAAADGCAVAEQAERADSAQQFNLVDADDLGPKSEDELKDAGYDTPFSVTIAPQPASTNPAATFKPATPAPAICPVQDATTAATATSQK